MFRWMRNNWKLLTAILLALIAVAVVVTLFIVFPPAATFITALPFVGSYIASLALTSLPAAAAVVGALSFGATLIACAAINLFNGIINTLDSWIKPKQKRGLDYDPILREESSDDENDFSYGKMRAFRAKGSNDNAPRDVQEVRHSDNPLKSREEKGKGVVVQQDAEERLACK